MSNVTLWWLLGSAGPALQHSQGRKYINMKLGQHEPVDSSELQVLWDQRSKPISQIKSKPCPDRCSCQAWTKLHHTLQPKGLEVAFCIV